MSENSTSWFHCARCGSLFPAPLGPGIERVCDQCGQNPSLGVHTIKKKRVNRTIESGSRDEAPRTGSKRKRRKKKSGAPLVSLIIGWFAIMGLIILAANQLFKPSDLRTGEWVSPQAAQRLTPEDHDLLVQYGDDCQEVLGNLISQTTPEGISGFVHDGLDTFSDIVRFYRLNPGTQITDTRLVLEDISVIHLPEGPAIEGRWKADDGRLIDVVFRRQDGEWLVDWHHFARYSEYPWPLFLAGDGPDEAEFRLLVRRRLARQVLEDEGPEGLSLAFHEPRFGRPDDPGPPSPVFELDWDSDVARMLMAGFEKSGEGRRPFRALLPKPEPDGDMMRVRVVIRRIGDAEEERRFEIIEVRAFHWIQTDDAGFATVHTGPEDSR